MIKPKVKIFRDDASYFGRLEKKINDWIEKENVSIVDFKTTQSEYYIVFSATYIPITKNELLTEKIKTND